MNFIEAIGSGFKRYFDFKTRSSRSEYWWFWLFTFLAGFVFGFVDGVMGNINPATGLGTMGVLITLVTFIPSLMLSIRRLHDIGKSGWWNLLFLTIIGIFVLLYWAVQPGSEEDNKYGSNPLKGEDTPSEAPAE